jgi:dTDP-4-dehydrorhamnose reductase
MRILITGASGQVGSDLKRVLNGSHEVLALDKASLDITQEQVVFSQLQRFQPDVLINCAAITKVDLCETERDLAWKVNGKAPGILARACREQSIPLFHLSTDYVFAGTNPISQPYLEADPTDPISFYGKSKLEGERQILTNTDNAIILRTSWVYGYVGANFLKAILRRACEGKKLRVVNDQVGSPTWSLRIAHQISRLLESEARGLFHATAEGSTTWYQVAQVFFVAMGMEVDLEPCSTADYPTPARRPANSILENARLKALGLCKMLPWQEDLTEFVGQFKDRLLQEARAK